MIRSLYSGVSGMKGFQTQMDVIANNISNVNTHGFKSSRVLFEDMISQTSSNASAPGLGLGGVNAKQVGLGVQVGATDMNTLRGNMESTGLTSDLYIRGEGYFVTRREATADSNAETYYTRDGAFKRDSTGLLVNPNGYHVKGQPARRNWTTNPVEYNNSFSSANYFTTPTGADDLADITIPAQITVNGTTQRFSAYTIDGDGLVTATYGSTNYVMGKVELATFNNPSGLQKVGSNSFQVSNNSGDPNFTTPGAGGSGSLESGYLEMSNVDLAEQFSQMIVASRAYQANARSITTSDTMLEELINLKR